MYTLCGHTILSLQQSAKVFSLLYHVRVGWSVVSIVFMLVSCHVIENQEIGFTKLKGGTESILALHRILAP